VARRFDPAAFGRAQAFGAELGNQKGDVDQAAGGRRIVPAEDIGFHDARQPVHPLVGIRPEGGAQRPQQFRLRPAGPVHMHDVRGEAGYGGGQVFAGDDRHADSPEHLAARTGQGAPHGRKKMLPVKIGHEQLHGFFRAAHAERTQNMQDAAGG